MSEETYVLGDVEVKKTGRQAQKPGPGGRTATLVEVTPVNDYDGSWKKWVNPASLFNIVSPSKEE